MDYSRIYINAVIASEVIQRNWKPVPNQMVYNKQKNELFYLGMKSYRKLSKNPDLKKTLFFIPQGHAFNAAIFFNEEPNYKFKEPAQDVLHIMDVMARVNARIKEDLKSFANAESVLSTRERRMLYYIFRYIEKKEFPGLILLSNN